MRWLNYQHLYYFWQVARVGSVTEASRRLRLAQPTISAQIKTLEGILNEPLFERKGRTLKLTESGSVAFRYAEKIFGLGDELLEVLEGKGESAMKELRIGISDVLPKVLVYRVLEPALSAHPPCTMRCLEDKTERLLADLAIAEVDVVIADRPIPPDVRVKAFNHFVGESGVTFLAPASLARRYKSGFPQSLADAPLILPTEESSLRHELDQWFVRLNIHPTPIGVFQDRALMKIFAREGKGIVPIPSVVENEVKAEFSLQVVGRTAEVKERVYVISTERRLKNALVAKICSEGQRHLFGGRRAG